MKIVIIFCFLIFLIISCTKLTDNSNEKFFLIEKIIDLPCYFEPRNVKLAGYNDQVLIHVPFEGDSLLFYQFYLDTDTIYNIFIKVADIDLPFEITNPKAESLSINDNYLVILYFPGFVIFKRFNDTLFSFYQAFKLNEYYQNVYLQKNQIIFTRCYNLALEDTTIKPVKISIFSIDSSKFTKSITPNFKHIEFSHIQPNQWIYANQDYIIISQTVDYSFEIYDRDLNLVTIVNNTNKNWKPLSTFLKNVNGNKNYDSLKYNPKLIIEDISEIDKNINRIETIQFINDSSIVICYSPSENELKKRHCRFYDIWHFNKDTCYLYIEGIKEIEPSENEICTYNNFTFYGNYYLPIYLKNKAVYISKGASAKYSFQPNIKYSSLNENIFKSIEKDGLFLVLHQFKCNL